MADMELPPDPAVLLNSLRGIGYSFEDAISDVIDNSISAQAQTINVVIAGGNDSLIVDIVDDGAGMDESAMRIALTLGARERDARLMRSAADLGRFGLGLKTASFSVARRLAIYTKQGAFADGKAWDLDDVRETGRWRVSDLSKEERNHLPTYLEGTQSGTVVRWSKIDRLQMPKARDQSAILMKLIERVRRHLGMIFHRFLAGVDADGQPIPKVSITMARSGIAPWNPLDPLIDRPELVDLGEPRYSHGLRAEHAILPPDTMLSMEERKQVCLSGHRMADMQGFYVYRANRLVCFASWLGLPGSGEGRWNKEQSTQLARVAVDISNGSDEEWALDVRKSKVVPPERDRNALVEVGNEARTKSRQRIFGRRAVGTTADGVAGSLPPLWMMEAGLLRLNRQHPLIEALTHKGNAGDLRPLVLSFLRHLEDSPALVSMVAEHAEPKAAIPATLDDTDIADVLALANQLRAAAIPSATVLEIILGDPRYRDPAVKERLRTFIEGPNK